MAVTNHDAAERSWVEIYRCFDGTSFFHLQSRREDGKLSVKCFVKKRGVVLVSGEQFHVKQSLEFCVSCFTEYFVRVVFCFSSITRDK